MNGITKNDLAANTVKIDFDALLLVASYAYVQLKQTVFRHLANMSESDMVGNPTARHLEAKYASEAAQQLAIAADMLSTLEQGRSRARKTLINT